MLGLKGKTTSVPSSLPQRMGEANPHASLVPVTSHMEGGEAGSIPSLGS